MYDDQHLGLLSSATADLKLSMKRATRPNPSRVRDIELTAAAATLASYRNQCDFRGIVAPRTVLLLL